MSGSLEKEKCSMAFNMAAAKARVVKPASAAKGPSVPFEGIVEGGFMVIRVPLTLQADQVREGKPNGKTGVQNPFINGTARFQESVPVTITDGQDSLTVYSRKTLTFNVFLGYAPQQGADDAEPEPA